MQDMLDKVLKDHTDMKVEIARLDGDIRTLKETVYPIKKEISILEKGHQKLEYAVAANDTKIETLRSEISVQLNAINEKLEPIPHLQTFARDVKIGAYVAGAIIVAGFTFVGAVIKVLSDMSSLLHGIAGS